MIPEQASQPQIQHPPSNKTPQRIGLFLLLAPIALFLITLMLFAVGNFFFAQLPVIESTPPQPSMRSTVNVILTLTGTLSVIGMIVGIPLGIFLLAQKDTPTQPTTL